MNKVKFLSSPIKIRLIFLFIFMVCTSFSYSPETSAAILDFTGLGPITNPIPQNYGDIANLDLSYGVREGFGNTAMPTDSSLSYYTTGYSGLIDVAFGRSMDNPSHVGEISFMPISGYYAILDNFDLGSWGFNEYDTQIRVYNADYSQIVYDSNPMSIATAVNYDLDISRNGAFHIQWQYPWNVAIDNVVYGAEAVPIPGAVWLFGSGLIALVGLRKKLKNIILK